MTRVLLALDGTDLDAHLVATARRVFGDAEYFALNVHHVAISSVPPPPGVVDDGTEADEAAADAEEQAAASVTVAGLEGAVIIGEVGNPAFTIPEVAEEHNVDVIVVGTHDRSWFSRLLEPSVASGVLHQTSIPVMIVHQ